MYTQCPDCGTAFRVTAEVLKQAAGKVRCGGCSNAFNALEYLSEKMPAPPAATGTDGPAPELTADPGQNDDDGPHSISAEQSAALLKTLDELAGSDIRIEDTGVEWRVLDEDEIFESAADEINEDPSEPLDELRFDDDTPLPDDFGGDEESTGEPAPSNSEETEADIEPETSTDSEIADGALGEPDDWAEILDEVDEDTPAAQLDGELESPENDDGLLDVDTQFALQAEEMGIDLSGMHQSVEDDTGQAVEPEHEIEKDDDDTQKHYLDNDEGDEQEEIDAPEEVDDPEDDNEQEEPAPLEFGSVDTAIEELQEQSDVFDADFFEAETSAEPEAEIDTEQQQEVPPQSDEEQTRNLMIDEELLSFAVEDEDGFASTIVIPEKDAEKKTIRKKEPGPSEAGRSPGFETIVMEGEFVRSALDTEKHEADIAAAALLAEQARTREEDDYKAYSGSRHRSAIGVVIGLAVLLLLQFMHQSREALATNRVFNNVVSPVYRAIGKPLSPAWDVTGWRIESRREELTGSADAGDEQLTIYPLVRNNSARALPYPLISVSLTDRFEEVIGSRVIEPAGFLSEDLDPRQLVQPGNTFTASISLNLPSQEALGYRLRVCYRLSSGQLRCHMPDFK